MRGWLILPEIYANKFGLPSSRWVWTAADYAAYPNKQHHLNHPWINIRPMILLPRMPITHSTSLRSMGSSLSRWQLLTPLARIVSAHYPVQKNLIVSEHSTEAYWIRAWWTNLYGWNLCNFNTLITLIMEVLVSYATYLPCPITFLTGDLYSSNNLMYCSHIYI